MYFLTEVYMYSVHCTKYPIYVFPEMKLCGPVPNAYIPVFVSDLHIYYQDRYAYLTAAK
jgi:hypothetical protein